jgi:hypothetical protein
MAVQPEFDRGAAARAMVERVMNKETGWPLPAESIAILEDLGARFYVCGPSQTRIP